VVERWREWAEKGGGGLDGLWGDEGGIFVVGR